MIRLVPVLLVSLLAACGRTGPQSTSSPNLDSGVTSSRGGATQVLGNQPNTGVTTPVR